MYDIAGQRISFSCQIPSLDEYEQTGAEIFSAPVIVSLPGEAISRSTGWVAGADRSVEVWTVKEGLLLRVSGFRDFYIAPGGKAILPVAGDSDLSELEREVVLGPALTLALSLVGKWGLHASAAFFHNHGMVFLGESGYGKSTLAAYLNGTGKQGWQRVADDILPVSLGKGGLTGWTHFPQLKLSAENQPFLNLPEKVLIDHIIQLAPEESAVIPRLDQVSANDVVTMLLRNTAGTRLFTPELLSSHMGFCADAARHVTAYRLSFAHQRDILPVVKELLEQSLKQE